MEDIKNPLPVAGYTAQPQSNVDVVNRNKLIEEFVLRLIDQHAKNPDFDQRNVSIARTHIEDAFMRLNRAVFKPERVDISAFEKSNAAD